MVQAGGFRKMLDEWFNITEVKGKRILYMRERCKLHAAIKEHKITLDQKVIARTYR